MRQYSAVVGGAVIEVLMFHCRQRRQGGAVIEWVKIVQGVVSDKELPSSKGAPSSRGEIIERGDVLMCCLLGP